MEDRGEKGSASASIKDMQIPAAIASLFVDLSDQQRAQRDAWPWWAVAVMTVSCFPNLTVHPEP